MITNTWWKVTAVNSRLPRLHASVRSDNDRGRVYCFTAISQTGHVSASRNAATRVILRLRIGATRRPTDGGLEMRGT